MEGIDDKQRCACLHPAHHARRWAAKRIMDIVPQVDDVRLVAVDPQGDLRLLERWLRCPHVVRWWGSPAQHLLTLSQRSSDTHALIIADARSVGYLCWQRPSREELEEARLTDLPETLVDIDILIGEPDYLGCGIGPRALVVLLGRLRSEGVTFAGVGTSRSNHRAMRAFEKAGFSFFRDFEDPDGPYKYMVVRLEGVVEQPVAADGAARRR